MRRTSLRQARSPNPRLVVQDSASPSSGELFSHLLAHQLVPGAHVQPLSDDVGAEDVERDRLNASPPQLRLGGGEQGSAIALAALIGDDLDVVDPGELAAAARS